jgi:hypothetical protein
MTPLLILPSVPDTLPGSGLAVRREHDQTDQSTNSSVGPKAARGPAPFFSTSLNLAIRFHTTPTSHPAESPASVGEQQGSAGRQGFVDGRALMEGPLHAARRRVRK